MDQILNVLAHCDTDLTWKMKNSVLYEVKKEKKKNQLGKTALELEPVSWQGGGDVEGRKWEGTYTFICF